LDAIMVKMGFSCKWCCFIR